MKILVTGASGFIGGAIARYFAARGFNVLAMGRRAAPWLECLPNIEYQRVDLTLNIPPTSCDICIHVAGLADDQSGDRALFNNNVRGTENLLQAIYQCNKIIFISSASVYDFSDWKTKSEHDTHAADQLSAYGKSKREAEHAVLGSTIPTAVILRPRAVYGAGDRTLLPRIVSLVRFGKMIVPGDLAVETSLTHVDNLCEAVDLAIQKAPQGRWIYNVTDTTPYVMKEVFAGIAKSVTGSPRLMHIPQSLAEIWIQFCSLLGVKTRVNRQSMDYLSNRAVLDTTTIKQELGYTGKNSFEDFLNSPAFAETLQNAKRMGKTKRTRTA